MQDDRRTSAAPWIAASVASVVLLALVLVFFVWLRPAQRNHDRNGAAAQRDAGQLSSTEQKAMNAAGAEMLNLVTFSRAHFDADFERALNGATGGLRGDVEKLKNKTLQEMQQGKFDLYGKLTNKALEGPVSSGKQQGYVVLVTINGYRSTSPDTPIQQNLQVTVVNVDGNWLANDVMNIGVQ